MHRRLPKVFLMIPLVVFFFIFISCATEAVKEEEKVTAPEKAKPKEEKEVAKPGEEKPGVTKVPKAEVAPGAEEKSKTPVTRIEKEIKEAEERARVRSASRRPQSEERAFTNIDIHFDFDKYNLKPRGRETLADKAYWLKKNPTVNVYIEGHCDERGTNEYNLVLGERRANSAKTYLLSLGIAPERLGTISYGEERPVDPGSNEEAWAKNRRAHFIIVSR